MSVPGTVASDALRKARERIVAALGANATLQRPADIAPYLSDFRGLYRGATTLVALPGTSAEVAAVLGICNELRVGVVPHGGNTGYCGGATPGPDGDQIVLALKRMNRIRALDAANYSVTVEAGCVLADLARAAQDADRLFPLSLGSEGSCQIGGNLSTNAGGLAAVHYGVARDLVLGLEVALADGRILDGLKSLRKDNTGYDLRHLFVGAEGTLGVITAASLKLFPRPVSVETAFIAVPDIAAAVTLLNGLRAASGDCVTSFEFLPRFAVDLTLRHVAGVTDPLGTPHPAYVLCELSTARADPGLRPLLEAQLTAAMDLGLVADAVLADSLAQREALWRMRESVPEAQRREGGSIKHDVSVPIADLPGFVTKATAAVLRIVPDARLCAYGHVGDGNLHFNVSQPEGACTAEFLARSREVENAVYSLTAALGGSISAEHGIGQLKRADLARFKSPVELEVMRSLKRSLDPHGILNPGKVLP